MGEAGIALEAPCSPSSFFVRSPTEKGLPIVLGSIFILGRAVALGGELPVAAKGGAGAANTVLIVDNGARECGCCCCWVRSACCAH